ncbi:hypothetical protein F66182_4564 [Fusarium sp. NRRL 66182]|nr:hypothetical protein F66182_4564 [Fusarium sp. NRRL 66182]
MTARDDEILRLQRELAASQEREKNLIYNQRNTSHDEYLRLCHEELFTTLKVQVGSKSTGGGTTDVTGKHYPLTLRHWEGFLDEQRLCHDIIKETIPGFLLPSRLAVRAIAEPANEEPLASEDDLWMFERLAIEFPVEKIIAAFGSRSQDHTRGREFNCKAITFKNQPLNMMESDNEACDSDSSDGDEPFHEAVQGQPGSRKRMALSRKVSRRRGPDKWVIHTRHSGEKHASFPGEYKAAYKLPPESFQKALRHEDLFTRVILQISSGKVSTDEEIKSQERLENTVAKALAQTFYYMLCLNSSYGYLTAGKSLIFLYIGDDPTVLFYYLSQPEIDAKGIDGSIDPFYTATAQLAAFCLRTCRDSRKSDSWKERAILQLSEWPQPYTQMRGGSTEEEPSQAADSASDSASSYTESIADAQELTGEPRRITRASCKPKPMPESGANDTSDDGSVDGSSRRSRGPGALPRTERPGPKKLEDIPLESDETQSREMLELEARPYCTQECILGLKRNKHLDEKCPNVALHRLASSGSTSHPIDAVGLRERIRVELGRPVYRLRSVKSLDGDGKNGATGALFKLSLNNYGYTFVGKGTYAAGVKRLRHEAEVYARIEPLQGHIVPVCLGSIDLDTPYLLAAADIVHMMIMSWAGDALTADDGFPPELSRFNELLLKHGVIHNDLAERNIVRNHERGHMLIDFDRAIVLPAKRHKRVDGLSHKKRKRRSRDAGIQRGDDQAVESPKKKTGAGKAALPVDML